MISYSRSEALLERALRSIPLGAQTFSKSYTQFPRGASPFFMDRAKGSRVWDVDGNEYIDFNNGLLSITLGHCDPDVTEAVIDQLHRGTICTLSTELEAEVSERIIKLVPCAQKVRFGKNGSDATAGAIRAARAFTGRDHVAVCGYHGWQDWYIGSTPRHKGVPEATRAMTHTFPYNDLEALETLLKAHDFAAVILEPMNMKWPAEGFLQGVVDLAHKYGAIAIFDECITGFRFAPGGASELFGVTPDLATFGKGLANGFPLSAVAGRADIMAEFENVHFSFTMGGETLSLAAAKATLDKLVRENVTEYLFKLGDTIISGVRELIRDHDCSSFLSIAGHPAWSFLVIDHHELWNLKTLYLQETLEWGILSLFTHNMTYAHKEGDVAHLLDVYDRLFPRMREAVETGDFGLHCEPLKPLFKIR